VSPAGLFAGMNRSTTTNGLAAVATDSAALFHGSVGGRALARYQGVLGQPLFVVSANTGPRITGQYTLDAFSDPFRTPQPLLRGPEYAEAKVLFHSRFMEGGTDRAIRASASSDWQSDRVYAHDTGEISVLVRNDLQHQATL
jgi:hypothetical protein